MSDARVFRGAILAALAAVGAAWFLYDHGTQTAVASEDGPGPNLLIEVAGAEAAAAAEATARGVFGAASGSLEMTGSATGTVSALPTLTLSVADVADGISLAQLFVRSGLAKSGKDAKRLIAEGGARLNDDVVVDTGLMLGAGELTGPVKLTAGRKRHALVVLE